jgi:Fe-Mn family superoxide dismutase
VVRKKNTHSVTFRRSTINLSAFFHLPPRLTPFAIQPNPNATLHVNLSFDITCVSAGHINHSLFWKNLAPSATERKGSGGVLKDGPLKTAICERWGTVDNLKKEFNTATAGIQGSGWGWLVRFRSMHMAGVSCEMPRLTTCDHQGFNPSSGKLEIVTTANQDPLLTHVPIIGVDIWEHAFYLQYLNVKVDVSP